MLKTLFNKVAGLSKRLQYSRYFPINIATFLRTPILKNICDRLLLKSITSFLVSSLKPLNTYFCQLTFFVIKRLSKAFPVPYFRLTYSRWRSYFATYFTWKFEILRHVQMLIKAIRRDQRSLNRPAFIATILGEYLRKILDFMHNIAQ